MKIIKPEEIESMRKLSTGGYAFKVRLKDGSESRLQQKNSNQSPVEFYNDLPEYTRQNLIYFGKCPRFN